MPVKVVIIEQNDLSSTALPDPREVIWPDFTVESFMEFQKAQPVSDHNIGVEDYLAYRESTMVSNRTGTVAVLVGGTGGMREFPEHYRPTILSTWTGRPCSIARDDALWMVGYVDIVDGGGGVYAWAYDEKDATHIARTLNQYPERFENVGVSSFSKNVNDPVGPAFPFDTFIRQQGECEWCVKGVPANSSDKVILAYARTAAEAEKLHGIFKEYPEFYSSLSYNLL